jgi:hypothetical protein
MSIIVFDEKDDGMAKAVELVGKLEVGLQPMACMALHKLMERTNRTQSVAVLLNVIKNWPKGVKQDFDPKAREALEERENRIIIETSDKILGKWEVKWESTAARARP